MRIHQWPDQLVPAHIEWRLEARTRSGGVATNGYEQIIGPPNDIWRADLEFPVAHKSKIMLWRAMQARLVGRVNAVWMRAFDRHALTGQDLFGVKFESVVPYSDGALFSDGAGFAPARLTVPIVVAAARHADQVEIDATQLVGYPTPGTYVGIGGWLYLIAGISPATDSVAVQLRPSLRSAVPSGAVIDFRPRVLVRFAADGTGALRLEYGRAGRPTLQVEEVLNRGGLSG